MPHASRELHLPKLASWIIFLHRTFSVDAHGENMPGAGRVSLPLNFPSAWSSIKTLVIVLCLLLQFYNLRLKFEVTMLSGLLISAYDGDDGRGLQSLYVMLP